MRLLRALRAVLGLFMFVLAGFWLGLGARRAAWLRGYRAGADETAARLSHRPPGAAG